MGLLDSAWWIAATITSWLPYMIGAVAVMLVGQLLALPLFTKCQASVTLVVFVALGSSHFGLYTLVGSIIDSKRASLLVAVGIYVFEMLLAWSLLSFGPVALSFSLVPSVLVPGFVQALLCAALVLQTVGSRFSQDPDISPPGVSWSSISSNPTEYYQSIGISNPDAVPTIATMLLINVALGTACFLLALYFDNVLERLDRPAQHWLYFVTPRYWGLGCGATSSTTSDQASAASATSVEMRDPDPDLDAEISQAHDPNAELSLRVVGVSHTYRRSSIVSWLASWSPLRNCCSSLKRGDTRALTDLHLTAGSGSIVCLLGANGSAKSTTVRIISGALTPTSGSVFVNGLSVRENAAAIRQSLGVCPQFDVLWPDLCVRPSLARSLAHSTHPPFAGPRSYLCAGSHQAGSLGATPTSHGFADTRWSVESTSPKGKARQSSAVAYGLTRLDVAGCLEAGVGVFGRHEAQPLGGHVHAGRAHGVVARRAGTCVSDAALPPDCSERYRRARC